MSGCRSANLEPAVNTAVPPRPHVMVSHGQPLLAAGLLGALGRRADMAVHDSEHVGLDQRIDVIITDYHAGLRWAEQARSRRLPRHLAQARVLVLAHSDREEEVRTALAGGVDGYLLIDSPIDEVAEGVCTLARGARFFSMSVAQRLAYILTREALTAREAEVLELLARGECNKSIARELQIAVGTVKAHVKAIMGKLDATSRTHAANIAATRGLVREPRSADGATSLSSPHVTSPAEPSRSFAL
jgi:DNA-binding NarL/FixJ family response regulator